MRKLAILIILIFSVSSLFAQMKRYEIKSGHIEYEITGSGNMMGMTTKITGKSSLLFKDYGSLELSHEKIIQNIMGQNEVTEDITKFDNNIVYSVNLEDKVIYKQEIPLDSDDPALSLKGKKSLIALGGKKIGNENLLGFNCEIWELSGIKMWMYKSVPLKTEATTMGMKQILMAKSVKFDISIDDDKFKLPDYPIKTRGDMMGEAMKEMKNMTPEQQKMMQDMMKNMGGMFEKKQ